MHAQRRRILAATAALASVSLLPASLRANTAKGGRVLVVGGGWGGLAAARHLRELAPSLSVTLLERNAAFHSLPLSNRWLANRLDGALLRHDYAAAAARFGYAFRRAEVTGIDRERREVRTGDGPLAYDWLILAAGIRDDYAPWFGDDADATAEARGKYGSAWQTGEVAALKTRLDRFAGGDFVIAVPPMPYRCPPAPFERACMIATLFRERQLKARVIVLDPNPMMQGFARVFGGQYRDRVVYVPQARVQSVDPFARKVVTDFETFRFDDATLMPPQRAGTLAQAAGLLAPASAGAAGDAGWAAVDPLTHRSLADPRVFVVGDMVGRVSPLFGQYPKTGQMAARQGQIAAAQIAAEALDREAARMLPESACYVLAGAEPMEMMRIETRYRVRGDGLLMQTVQQHYDAQPRDEDIAWAKGMFSGLFGDAAG